MLWQDRLRTLPEQVELNTNNIAELGNDLNTTNGTVTKVINDLTATNLKVNNNTDKIAVNARDIEQNRLVISGVAGKVETNITNIATNKTNIANINNVLPTKADKTTVEALDTRVSSIEYREQWKQKVITPYIEFDKRHISFSLELMNTVYFSIQANQTTTPIIYTSLYPINIIKSNPSFPIEGVIQYIREDTKEITTVVYRMLTGIINISIATNYDVNETVGYLIYR